MPKTSVTKSELVERMARGQKITIPVARRVIDTLLDAIAEQLVHGGRVEIRSFGVFDVRWRPPRQCRNPSSGEKFFRPRKPYPKFRASRFMSYSSSVPHG